MAERSEVAMPVIDRDRGMKALRRELAYLGSHHARIGVLSGPGRGGNVQAQAPKKSPPKSRRKKRGSKVAPASGTGRGLTVAEVFAWHELGLGRNPKRSSIGWVEKHKQREIVAFQTKLLDLVLAQKMGGKEALWVLGEKAQSLVKARIVSGIPPALSPEYLKRKEVAGGKKTPLIWTGQLLNSIRYKVVAT
jgi:hypothetical protein